MYKSKGMMKKKWMFLVFIVPIFAVACGKNGSLGSVNPNFPDAASSSIQPSVSVNPNNQEQVTVVEAATDSPGAAIGQIADQDPSRTLCVIIDPKAGEEADLEICEGNKANTETTSASGICPDAVAVTRCASRNVGSGPDFCQVTGAPDYIFVIINPSKQPSTVAYQVIDVTGTPNKSCADLNITEDTIKADDF